MSKRDYSNSFNDAIDFNKENQVSLAFPTRKKAKTNINKNWLGGLKGY